MRKGVAFISAVLATFSLVVLASVVYTYRGLAASRTAVQSPKVQEAVAMPASDTVSSVVVNVSPQTAASIAGTYLNRTDPFSAELVTFNGAQAYKVVFTSGDVVYVSMTGQVLSAVPAPVSSAGTSQHRNRDREPNSGGGGGGGGHGGGSHGGGDDHGGDDHSGDDGG